MSQTEIKSKSKPKPIVKWAGGKQAIARTLATLFPEEFNRFYEPFFGGGSVFLTLLPQRAVAGDLNRWLLETYAAIRDDWRGVAEELDKLVNTKDEFLRIRAIPPESLDPLARAAQLVYLNKTCFRGLFRVNRKGQFNVPYGAYDRRYYSPENFEIVSDALKGVEFRIGDFELCLNDVQRGDFVYFDPPYFKLGGYSDFNRYTSGQFRENDHLRLASLCSELDLRGVKWAVSNSETDFVRTIFQEFNFHSVEARREINLKSSNRSIKELLITNY